MPLKRAQTTDFNSFSTKRKHPTLLHITFQKKKKKQVFFIKFPSLKMGWVGCGLTCFFFLWARFGLGCINEFRSYFSKSNNPFGLRGRERVE